MVDTYMRKCSVKNCEGVFYALGFCAQHYVRYRRKGDVDADKPIRGWVKAGKKCLVESCLNIFNALYGGSRRGYCSAHYRRILKNGEVGSEPILPAGKWERKQTKKAIKMATLRDIEWAAGFCEGEASFGKTRNSASVALPQTESREPLERMLSLFGGSINFIDNTKIRQQGINRRDQELWSISGSRARGFMMTIYSLMSPKRQYQIKIALGIR